jgi:predicted ATPase/class 3 adenylate cyclase/Flp pilus assembly protein TadD
MTASSSSGGTGDKPAGVGRRHRSQDDRERWKRVSEILNRAVDRPPGERNRFVSEACAGDRELVEEVEELLRAHEEGDVVERLGRGIMEPLLRTVRGEPFHDPDPDRYRLKGALGRGGMGIVYRARDLRLERDVALKFLPSNRAVAGKARERFLQEARAAAKLDHPNICTVHEIGETPEGGLFIAMPLYRGETLRKRLARGAPGWEEALEVVVQVAAGLARAHEAGIVHRDIKPANLFLTREGLVKILDFGVAKATDTSASRDEGVPGTVAYMSPEQARGETVDGRSDLWSLGAVLYEMLTGERLFPAEDPDAALAAIRSSEPLRLGRLRGAVPVSVLSVVEGLLARDPAGRIASAADLLRRLETATTGLRDGVQIPDHAPALTPEGERRQATVLALRITGYDALLDRLPQGEVEGRMARLQGAVREVVERHGGALNEVTGDRLTAVFGVPMTREDDVLRAVRAAGDLKELAELSPDRWGEEPLGFRAGIATGTLVVRPGASGTEAYRLGGAEPDIAARLAAGAAPGEIWLDPASRRGVEAVLTLEPAGSVSGPEGGATVAAARVQFREGAAGPDPTRTGFDPARLTTYTGRAQELGELTSAFRRVLGGEGQLATVVGEAGMGKSRLVLELRRRVEAGDGSPGTGGEAAFAPEVQVFHGQCQSYAGRGPYHPFVDILLQVFGLDGGGGTEAEGRIVTRILEIEGGLERYVSYYLHLLSIPSRRFPVPRGFQGEQFRAGIREAVIALITLVSEEAPLLLLLEDWHWADEASRELLRQLAGSLEGHSVLVVVTARPGYGTEWDGAHPRIHVHLRPLAPEASARMVRALMGNAEVPPEVAGPLHDRTGGNPFFLEELCYSLREAGMLRVEEGRAGLMGAPESLHLPTTIQGVIRTRLDRLPAGVREVVRAASVLGREFDLPLLERVAPPGPSLVPTVEQLVSQGILQQTRVVPERRFRFKHALTQEVAYDTLLGHQRVALHERAGRALAALHPHRLREEAPRLAHHFSRAERWEEAVRHGLEAARRARELSEFADALERLEEVDGWLARLPPGAARREREAEAILQQEEVCETLGLRGRQQELLDRVEALVGEEGDPHRRAEILRRKGDVYTLLRSFDEAESALATALELAREVDEPKLQGSVLRSLGLTGWHRGRTDEALRHIDEALALDRARGDARAMIADLNNRAKILKDRKEYREALAALEEALRLLETSPSDVKTTYILHNIGIMHRALGEDDLALEVLTRTERLARERHLPVQRAFHLTSLAHIQLDRGEVDEAVQTYETAVSVARDAQYAEGLAHSLKPLGEVLAGVGRKREALSYLQEAARVFGQLGDAVREGEVWRKVAELAGETGDFRRARDAWGRVLELVGEEADPGARLAALEGMARAGRATGEDPSLVRATLDEALELARDVGDRRGEGRILNGLAILEWCRGDLALALERYEAALEIFRELGDEVDAGLMLNSLGVTLARMGRRQEARTLLREALDTHGRTGEALLEGHALAALGDLDLEEGDLEGARDRFARSLEIRRAIGDRAGEGWMNQRLARVNAVSGRMDVARTYLESARRIARERDDAELLAAVEEISE